jgi:hypothetical protein
VGVAVGFVGTLALIAGALALIGSPPPPSVEPASPRPAAAAHPPAPAPTALPPRAVPAAVPDAAPVQVVLAIESEPSGAVVTLDGRSLGKTPLDARVEPDGREHTVTFELVGFRPEARQVLVDRDRALAVALKRRDRATARPPTPMDIKEGR